MTNQNSVQEEIKSRLKEGNSCYYSVQTLLSSRLLSKNLNIKIYKTIILTVFLYGCEAWSLTLMVEMLSNFWSENFFRRAEQKFWGYWITAWLTHNARVCNARSGKVGSSHCYLDRRPLPEISTFDEIVYVYDRKHSQQLVYVALSRVIL